MPSSVKLHVYDLSQGLARQMSMGLLGTQIDAIYHTGIALYGYEYFYGGGIQAARVGTAIPGMQYQVIDLGATDVTPEDFHNFLREISPRFTMQTYHLFNNNCNNFTDECSKFLIGRGIPQHIVGLPETVLNTPMGQMFRPMIDSMMGGGNPLGNSEFGGGGQVHLPPISYCQPNDLGRSPLPSASPNAPASAPSAVNPPNVEPPKTGPSLKELLKPLLSTDPTVAPAFSGLRKHAQSVGSPLTGDEAHTFARCESLLAKPKLDSADPVPDDVGDLLCRMYCDWEEKRFLVLFIARRLALLPEGAKRLTNSGMVTRVFDNLSSDTASSNVRQVALSVASNLLSQSSGVELMMTQPLLGKVLDLACRHMQQDCELNERRAASALVLNVCLKLPKTGSDEQTQCICSLFAVLESEQDGETQQRILTAIGALVLGNTALQELVLALGFTIPPNARHGPHSSLADEVASLLS